MSALLDRATMIVIYLLVALIIVGMIAGLVFLLYRRKNKNKVTDNEMIDYTSLKREDAKDYIKFEDICDDMIVTDNGKRFIAVIRCKGTDFFSAHSAEKFSIQAGYRSFIQTISKPMTYRQYTQRIDMEHTDKKYVNALNRHKEILYNLEEDYKEYQKSFVKDNKSGQGVYDEKEHELYETEQTRLKKLMETEKWHIYHLEDQILYSGQIGGTHAIPKGNETYIFDWSYNPFESPMELSQEEIHKKAIQELKKLSDAKIHALSQAKVRAYRCRTPELIEMFRRHTNPLSAERFKMSDLRKSSYFKDIAVMKENEIEKDCVENYVMDVMTELQKNMTDGIGFFTDVDTLAFEKKGEEIAHVSKE